MDRYFIDNTWSDTEIIISKDIYGELAFVITPWSENKKEGTITIEYLLEYRFLNNPTLEETREKVINTVDLSWGSQPAIMVDNRVSLIDREESINQERIKYETTRTIFNTNFDHYYKADGTRSVIFNIKDFGYIIDTYNVWHEYIGFTTASVEPIEFELVLPEVSVAMGVFTGTNFTDEENPSVKYQLFQSEYTENIQLALSYDGVNEIIPYRRVSKGTGDVKNYTFTLTDEERNTLRVNAVGSNPATIYYMAKVYRKTPPFVGDLKPFRLIENNNGTWKVSHSEYGEFNLSSNYEIFSRYGDYYIVMNGDMGIRTIPNEYRASVNWGLEIAPNLYLYMSDEIYDEERQYYYCQIHTQHINQELYCECGFGAEDYHYITDRRKFTVIGAEPILDPTLKDVNSTTVALTGDENTFIRHASMVEFTTGAQASKGAEIIEQYVQCGSKVVYNSFYGVIDDPEENEFYFRVRDNRNQSTVTAVFSTMVPYVKPTCNQEVIIDVTDPEDIEAQVIVNISGNYYNGSFGAVHNELILEVRHTDNEGNMGEWERLSDTPTFNNTNNTYKLTVVFPGLRYDKSYVFQCRATDKLNVVETAQYTTRLTPVYDWGEEDFNFNVPVKMNGKTVLRHNTAANNTVLSASGGHIYLRPGGTDETSGQTIINPDGSIDFGGVANFSETANFSEININEMPIADYVIDQGEASMGSNGTWYWRMWASGKAECWGCRNFGNMATNSGWGTLYTSTPLSQNLPEDLFARTPDAININFVHATGAAWICKHNNTAPSAVTTGSFVVVRPVSGNISAPTNIGFHIIGEWY
jgi:hypothetical protein